MHRVTESIVRIHCWSGTNCQDLYMYCPRTDLVASTVLRHVTRTCHFCHHVVSLSLKCWLHARENVLSVPVLAACTRKRPFCPFCPFCPRAGCMYKEANYVLQSLHLCNTIAGHMHKDRSAGKDDRYHCVKWYKLLHNLIIHWMLLVGNLPFSHRVRMLTVHTQLCCTEKHATFNHEW